MSPPVRNVRRSAKESCPVGGTELPPQEGVALLGSLLGGADAVLLAEREIRAGQALAIAFLLVRLDSRQHRAEPLVGDEGALFGVRVLVEDDAAGARPLMREA